MQLQEYVKGYESSFIFCFVFLIGILMCVCVWLKSFCPVWISFHWQHSKSQLLISIFKPLPFLSSVYCRKSVSTGAYFAPPLEDEVIFILAQRVAGGRNYYRITCWVDSINKSPVCETHCYVIITKGQGFRETLRRLGVRLYEVSNQTCHTSANITISFRNEGHTGFRI